MRLDVERAIAAGAEFLSARRSRDGMWRDFHTAAGASADWLTAFVCDMTSGCVELRADVAAATAALAARQRANGGWGYNHATPTDCDSTAWALLALSARQPRDPEAVVAAGEYLKSHQLTGGGFATYSKTDGIDRFIGAVDADATAGWLSPHPCVTSVALRALRAYGEPCASNVVTRAREYLGRARDERGNWMSYWWPGPAYNTFFALYALSTCAAIDGSDVRAVPLDADPGAFHAALASLALLLVPGDETLRTTEAVLEHLIGMQRRDGGWPSRPILRIPHPTHAHAEMQSGWTTDGNRGSGVIVADPRGVFTSAAAVSALTRYRAVCGSES